MTQERIDKANRAGTQCARPGFAQELLAAALGASLLLASPMAASAGATQDPSGKPVPPEVMNPPTESTTPPPDASTGGDKPKEPLTEQLKEGEGVLEPPKGIDPEIKKPIPDEFRGTLPVIPPPGEPGGDPAVQPK